MGEFRVKIKTDGADSFDQAQEIHRLLVSVVASLDERKTSGRLFDVNGNEVGEFYFVDD